MDERCPLPLPVLPLLARRDPHGGYDVCSIPLSLRNVEDLLFECKINLCHGTVRLWWSRFGPMFAADIRRQWGSRMRGFRRLVSSRPINQEVMHADALGERVLAAIRANELYIFSHPEYGPLVDDRIDAIRASWTPSAQADYVDPQWLIDGSRNPVWQRIANHDFS